MNDIADINSTFEAVKVAMTQDKNGHILKLSIHPNDTPEDIMRDLVGTRYMVVLVRVSDEGEPVPSQSTEEGIRAVKLAGTLCGDENFQQWVCMVGGVADLSEETASVWLRRRMGVTSRKDLKTNANARSILYSVRDEFTHDLRNGKLL